MKPIAHHNSDLHVGRWRFKPTRGAAWSLVFSISVLLTNNAQAQETIRPKTPERSILQYNETLAATPMQHSSSGVGLYVQKASHPTKTDPELAADAGEKIDGLLTKLVLGNIPHTFEEDKDWGGQKERWDGVDIRRDGLRIETNRKKKMVNHGTWKKYSAELLDPDQQFTIQLKNMRQVQDDKIAFDVHFQAHLKVHGRQSKWVKGVQLYSFSADGHAQVRLKVSIELAVRMDASLFPPDMIFEPRAQVADLVIDEFRIDRVSKLGGEFAQQVSKSVRDSLDRKVEEKEVKLVEKINKEFEKKQDKLRLSIADAMKSKWTSVAKPFLPGNVKSAIDKSKD